MPSAPEERPHHADRSHDGKPILRSHLAVSILHSSPCGPSREEFAESSVRLSTPAGPGGFRSSGAGRSTWSRRRRRCANGLNLEAAASSVGKAAADLPWHWPDGPSAGHQKYDKAGEEHLAALPKVSGAPRRDYSRARAGEDLYIARRMILCLRTRRADPMALTVAMASMQAFHFIAAGGRALAGRLPRNGPRQRHHRAYGK
jgi:hypothetical protein